MKALLTILIALALAGNAILAFRHLRISGSLARVAEIEGVARLAAIMTREKLAARTDSSEAKWAKLDWSALSEADLQDLPRRLAAAGFSRRVVFAVVSAVVKERFAKRYRPLAAAVLVRSEYWRNVDPLLENHAARDQLATANKEIEAIMAKLFGAEYPSPDFADKARRQYPYLDVQKSKRLEHLQQDYADLKNDILVRSQYVQLPEDREKRAFLEKEFASDLVRLLTPEELAEYELRHGRAANLIRNNSGSFELTEQEFREMYAELRTAMDTAGKPGADLYASTQAGPGVFTELARKSLSPERSAEFQLKSDTVYVQAERVIQRLNLPEAVTAEVVAVQKDFTRQASSVRADRTLGPEQRQARLTALTEEATRKLTASLGGQLGFQAYRDQAGRWLLPPPSPRN